MKRTGRNSRRLTVASALLLFFTVGIFFVSTTRVRGSDTEFYRSLLEKKYASFGDALKAMDILQDGSLEERSFKKRFEALKKEGIVKEEWKNKKSSDGLKRGELAYMLAIVLDIEGGLIMRIFGVTERYAYKELVYIGIMAGGESSRLVRGEELVSVLRAASEYRNAQGQ